MATMLQDAPLAESIKNTFIHIGGGSAKQRSLKRWHSEPSDPQPSSEARQDAMPAPLYVNLPQALSRVDEEEDLSIPGTPLSQQSTRASDAELASQSSPLPPSPPMSPEVAEPCWRQFSFTLRRADDAPLGMGVLDDGHGRGLLVAHVHSEGAIPSWNNLCADGPDGTRLVQPGARVIQVNGARDPDRMIAELMRKQLLSLTVETCWSHQGPAPTLVGVGWMPVWPSFCSTSDLGVFSTNAPGRW